MLLTTDENCGQYKLAAIEQKFKYMTKFCCFSAFYDVRSRLV